MINKNIQKILAVIPARGKSKGIPNKNIIELAGKPLIVYSIENALKSRLIDRIVVSTEDEDIYQIAKKYDIEVIKRPDELAENHSHIGDTLNHILEYLENKEGYIPKFIILLQPTSPLRTVKTIDSAIEKFCDKFEYYDSLIPLYALDGKIGVIKGEMFIPNYILGSRRQDMEPLYRECGTIFIFKPSFIKRKTMFGEKIYPFIIRNYEESIDIDTLDDLKQAEYFLRLRN